MEEEEKKMVDGPFEQEESSHPDTEHSKLRSNSKLMSSPQKRRHNKTAPAYDIRDDGDEEDPEDPFVYSDDSASLSDAYFLPQSDDELFAQRPSSSHRYREEDPLKPVVYPYASYYGSMNGGAHDRALSPLWTEGAIQEDAEHVAPPLRNNKDENGNVGIKERKRQRKRAMLKQRERSARELAVVQVRGKPQSDAQWKDPIFAFIFVLQLLVITGCAVHFGSILLKENAEVFRAIFPSSNPSGSFHWDRSRSSNSAMLLDSDVSNSLEEISSLNLPDATSPPTSSETLAAATINNVTSLIVSNATSSRKETIHDAKIKANPTSFAFTIDYKNIIALVSVAGFYACILTYISFGFMLILSRALIQIMLVFSVLLALAWGTIGLTLDPYGVIAVMGFASLLLTLGYTIASWNRIPFAATNLYTALCAMRCTADITILGLTSLLVAFAWCVIWTLAFVGIVNSFNSAECSKNDVCEPHVTSGHIPLYLVLLFSFHWTNTVIKNVVRVTVASAIGTWWFDPNSVSNFCTSAVLRPLFRSLTTSLGSICYGSLVSQPSRFVSTVTQCCCSASSSTKEDDGKSLLSNGGTSTDEDDERSAFDSVGICTHFCFLRDRCRAFLRSCNRWSFTYIGMYGYGFREAGERALQLFETREWVDVVKDNLVQNVLLMASFIIGGSTGTFAVIVEETDGLDFTSFHKPIISAFLVGSVIGFVLSNILLLGLIGSAVNTVLVCFAAGPFEFDKNHPRLSREMRDAWTHHVWEA